MKRLIIAIALLASVTACKKEYNTYHQDTGTSQDVTPTTGEVTNVSDQIILANTWTNVGGYAYNANDVRVWKYKSGNYVVIINNVPAELFWNPQFAIGTNISGRELLNIKQRAK